MISIDEAIKIIESSKYSHITWIQWYQNHPEDIEKYKDTCGDIQHHQECIDNYNKVINLLENIKCLPQ